MNIGFNNRIPLSQTVYDIRFESCHYITCLWCLYPIFALKRWLRSERLWIYYKLNKIGAMKTQEGLQPKLSNIRIMEIFKKKKPQTYQNVIAGYFLYDSDDKKEK
jgi:hypothetical protein